MHVKGLAGSCFLVNTSIWAPLAEAPAVLKSKKFKIRRFLLVWLPVLFSLEFFGGLFVGPLLAMFLQGGVGGVSKIYGILSIPVNVGVA